MFFSSIVVGVAVAACCTGTGRTVCLGAPSLCLVTLGSYMWTVSICGAVEKVALSEVGNART